MSIKSIMSIMLIKPIKRNNQLNISIIAIIHEVICYRDWIDYIRVGPVLPKFFITFCAEGTFK